MQSVFIKSGNQIFNREQICGVQYNKADEMPDMFRFNGAHKSKLSLFTVDGREVIFYDRKADILWDVLSDSAIDLTPKASVAQE